ncbi:MAG: ATP-binding protein [Thaumarchaeota archaeon]|nr:ATP-binding protein [Nitrososphaerota archaeon]
MSRLVLFCGVPGSGKTTIAASLALKLPQSAHIQTDKLRAMVRPQKYSARESRFVYSAVIAMGRQALIAGYDAILDGTFPREDFRKEALDRLAHLSSAHLVVHTICDMELALKRTANRSDAMPKERLLRINRRFEVPEEAVVIDTGKTSVEAATDILLAMLKRRDSWP